MTKLDQILSKAYQEWKAQTDAQGDCMSVYMGKAVVRACAELAEAPDLLVARGFREIVGSSRAEVARAIRRLATEVA